MSHSPVQCHTTQYNVNVTQPSTMSHSPVQCQIEENVKKKTKPIV